MMLGLMLAVVLGAAHPCDASLVRSATVTEGSLVVGWCHSGLDVNGQPATITGWVLYANTVRTAISGVQTDGVPNGAGLVYYEGTVQFTRGSYTVQIAAVNAFGEGARSDPFALNVGGLAGVPIAPTLVRVR